jgi:hypothetical protein
MSKLRSRQHRPTGNQLQFPAASESGAAAARSASACLRPMCARSRDTPPSIACRKAGNSDPVRSNLLLCLIDASTSATATSCGLTALAFPAIAAGQLHVPKLVDRFNLPTHRTLPHVAIGKLGRSFQIDERVQLPACSHHAPCETALICVRTGLPFKPVQPQEAVPAFSPFWRRILRPCRSFRGAISSSVKCSLSPEQPAAL